jgi:hypothetical protein
MWIAENPIAVQLKPAGGEIAGKVDQPAQQQASPNQLFNRNPPTIVVFRLRTNQNSAPLNCRFEGVLFGPLNHGDTVVVQGVQRQGGIEVTRIKDCTGAIIGQNQLCFVATAVFGGSEAPQLRTLRAFRDDVLLRGSTGRWLVGLYWRWGPIWARMVGNKPWFCGVLRLFFMPLCWLLKQVSFLWSSKVPRCSRFDVRIPASTASNPERRAS